MNVEYMIHLSQDIIQVSKMFMSYQNICAFVRDNARLLRNLKQGSCLVVILSLSIGAEDCLLNVCFNNHTKDDKNMTKNIKHREVPLEMDQGVFAMNSSDILVISSFTIPDSHILFLSFSSILFLFFVA